MKTRLGFVSNSSSSSFTCDICRYEVSGMDLGLSDVGMASCSLGHTYCESHAPIKFDELDEMPIPQLVDIAARGMVTAYSEKYKNMAAQVVACTTDGQKEALYLANQDLFDDWLSDLSYEAPPEFCPICQFQDVPDRDLVGYFLKTFKMSRPGVVGVIKEAHNGDYKRFREWLKAE